MNPFCYFWPFQLFLDPRMQILYLLETHMFRFIFFYVSFLFKLSDVLSRLPFNTHKPSLNQFDFLSFPHDCSWFRDLRECTLEKRSTILFLLDFLLFFVIGYIYLMGCKIIYTWLKCLLKYSPSLIGLGLWIWFYLFMCLSIMW